MYLVQPLARLKYIEDLMQIHLNFEGICQKNTFKDFQSFNFILTYKIATTALFIFLTLLPINSLLKIVVISPKKLQFKIVVISLTVVA